IHQPWKRLEIADRLTKPPAIACMFLKSGGAGIEILTSFDDAPRPQYDDPRGRGQPVRVCGFNRDALHILRCQVRTISFNDNFSCIGGKHYTQNVRSLEKLVPIAKEDGFSPLSHIRRTIHALT